MIFSTRGLVTVRRAGASNAGAAILNGHAPADFNWGEAMFCNKSDEVSPLGDLPPHVDAWCPGTAGDNPAYVSARRNSRCAASLIAVNVTLWAMNGAAWANAMRPSLGVRA
jgi:hypothetical protein